jgi:hypothetical protein
MAAVTPTTVTEVSVGNLKGTIAVFANTLDTSDTWASGIPNIVFLIPTQEDVAGTATSQGVGASFSGSTITFYIGEDNAAVRLLVLSGQAY